MAPATTKKERPAVQAQLLTPYPAYVPALDAPPLSTFWQCRCGMWLLERIWHNRTDEQEAHWEICEPPITAVLGVKHVCDASKEDQ